MDPMTWIILVLCVGLGIGLLLLASKNKGLTSLLQQANEHSEGLSREIRSLEKAKADLDGDLKQEQQQNETLKKTKAEALWILYLLRLSLIASLLRLSQEQTRFMRLDKSYRELEKVHADLSRRYRDTVEAHNKTAKEYSKFRNEVQSKAQRRVATKAGSAALSLIPGFGLLDLLINLGEILEAITDTDEIVEAIEERLRAAQGFAESLNDIGQGDFDASLPDLHLPDLGIDAANPSAVSEESVRRTVQSLEQHLPEMLKTPEWNWDQIDTLTGDVMQGTAVSLELTPGECSEAGEAAFAKLQAFVTEAYDYRKTHPSPNEESSVDSTDSLPPNE